jgi:hypothetical protein
MPSPVGMMTDNSVSVGQGETSAVRTIVTVDVDHYILGREAPFLEQGLQVFFGSLLAVEADRVIMLRPHCGEVDGRLEVGLGLADPFGG